MLCYSNLVFKSDLNPLGFNYYTIQQTNSEYKTKKLIQSSKSNFYFENQHLKLTFNSIGNLIEIYNKDTDTKLLLNQSFCYYQANTSNAYVFRPSSTNSTCIDKVSSYSQYNGNQFVELHQIYNSWISQTIRLYNNSENVEFEWRVGPIDTSDDIGRDIILRFESDMQTNSTFYTDANGRQIMKRVLNYRESWPFVQTQPISGNYFPVNSRIFIREELTRRQLTLITDRSLGGSSIKSGSIEIMLHRRHFLPDSLVGTLNELGVDGKGLIVKGLFNLIFSTIEKSARLHRNLAHKVNTLPLIMFMSYQSNQLKNKIEINNNYWKGLVFDSLPSNLHLLTFMNEYDNTESENVPLIVRIEHFYEPNEDTEYSKPVTIDLREVFSQIINVIGIEELSLGTNMKADEINQRLKWNSQAQQRFSKNNNNLKLFTFTFNPMQIRTFRVFYDPK